MRAVLGGLPARQDRPLPRLRASYCARLADVYEAAEATFAVALRDVEVADEIAREAKP